MEQASLPRTLTVSQATPVATVAPPRTFAVGQILSATVLAAGRDGAPSVLRLGAEQVEARSRLPLRTGQSLRLQVTASGPPAVMQLLGPQAADTLAALEARVLRAALPQQQPLGRSLATLQQVSEQPASRRGSDLPEAARALLSDLLASLPRPRDAADAGRLLAMVRASGLFHEAELAQAAARAAHAQRPGQADPRGSGGADFKARVAAVAELVRQGVEGGMRDGSLREADRALRAVLARIETNQAISVRATHEQAPQWRMDLPFCDEHGAYSVGLRIRREQARGRVAEDGDASWVVDLHVDTPDGRPLHARVSLTGGAVHTLFTSDDADLLARVEAGSVELTRRLQAHALEVGGVRCCRATVASDDTAATVSGLVDERA